jgi:hypothetical protein
LVNLESGNEADAIADDTLLPLDDERETNE